MFQLVEFDFIVEYKAGKEDEAVNVLSQQDWEQVDEIRGKEVSQEEPRGECSTISSPMT